MRRDEPEMARGLLPSVLFEPFLPTPTQTLLLRFCLAEGGAAVGAWERWCREVGDPGVLLRAGPKSVRGLSVLMLEALRRHDVPRTSTAFHLLRLSVLKEEMRTDAYRKTLGPTLAGLRKAGIDSLLLKGASLAETIYEQPLQRHCHDIDLMVRGVDLARATRALEQMGFRRVKTRVRCHQHISFTHDNELPLELHTTPLPLAGSEALIAPFWDHSHPAMVADTPARVPAPEDNLVHVLAATLSPQRRRYLRWVTDAWFLIHRTPGFDWEAFTERVHQGQLSLPSLAALNYLADDLGAAVPRPVLESLAEASHREPFGRDNTINALWSSTRKDLRALNWLVGGQSFRRPVLQWLLRPSAEYLQFTYGSSGRRTIPMVCARRAMNFIAWRARYAWRRSKGSSNGFESDQLRASESSPIRDPGTYYSGSRTAQGDEIEQRKELY